MYMFGMCSSLTCNGFYMRRALGAHHVSRERFRESRCWTGRGCVNASGKAGFVEAIFWLRLVSMPLVMFSPSKPFFASILRALFSFRFETRLRPKFARPAPAATKRLWLWGWAGMLGC